MASLSTIQTALHTWVSNATGATTVWANQNEPRPENYPFVVMNVTDLTPDGGDYLALQVNGAGDFDECVISRRVLTLNVQCFSDSQAFDSNGRYYLELAAAEARRVQTREAFAAADLGLVRAAPVQNLDQVINGAWESRWSINFTFNALLSYEPAGGGVNAIDTVVAENQIVSPAETLTIPEP